MRGTSNRIIVTVKTSRLYLNIVIDYRKTNLIKSFEIVSQREIQKTTRTTKTTTTIICLISVVLSISLVSRRDPVKA